jgi:hypothetical protein
MNSYVGPGKGGGSSWTISLIARGSSIGADRGVPSAVDGCGSLPMGDDIDAKGMGSGGNDDVLGNISVGGGVGLDTGGLGSDRGSLKTSGVASCTTPWARGAVVSSGASPATHLGGVRNTRGKRTALGDDGGILGGVLSSTRQQLGHVNQLWAHGSSTL